MGDIYTIHNLEYEYLRGDTITLTSLNGKTNVTIPSEVTIEYPFMSGTYKTVRVNNIGINVGNNMYDNKTVTITFERDMSTYIFNSYNQDDDTSTAFGNNQGANFTINTNTTKERFESLFGPVENFDENKTLSQRSFMFYPMNQNTTFNFVFLPSDYSPKSFTYTKDTRTYNFSILPSPKPSMKSLMSHMRLHHPLARQTHFQDYSQHIRKRVALNEHKLAMK